MKKGTLQRLRKAGFDSSEYNRSKGTYHVQCSQCDALVINGVACHETGCPNVKKED
uniref:Uncharacterized protein n=1 Tax=viral metagenome TaxID=1070528 RepID=A0A6M3JQQ2_9ZZZZ